MADITEMWREDCSRARADRMVNRYWLIVIDIDTSACDPPRLQCLNQGGHIDDRGTRRVDKDPGRLHRGEIRRTEQSG